MTMYYYRDATGSYVGGFDVAQPGLIECEPPSDGRMIYDDETGTWLPPALPPLDLPALFETARLLVNAHVDTVARAKGYNDAAACASYLASTNPTWSAEATAFIAWRDAVWAHVFTLRDQALAGEIETLPGGDELIAGLPVMTWPS